MLGIVILVGFIVGWICIPVGQKTKNKDYDVLGGWGILGLVLIIVFGILIGVWGAVYFDSLGIIGDMQAFHRATKQNYEVTIEHTKDAIVRLDQMSSLLSAENLKQSTNLSNRIVELRKSTSRYNTLYSQLKIFNDNIWLNWFYADLPEELGLMILELNEE